MNVASRIALLACILISLGSFVFYQPWERGIVGGGDSSGYYAYLPSVFIYQDLTTMDECNTVRRAYGKRGNTTTTKLENGNHLNQYTYGVALLNLPAFTIAHTYCYFSGDPQDGYSPPYNFMIVFSGMLYVWFGLFFLRRFLLPHFTEEAVAGTLILLGLGTNLYFMAILKGAMAHGYLFFLISLFLYILDNWKSAESSKKLFLVAFLLGLITLVRPNLLVVALVIPFFIPKVFLSLLKKPKNYLLAVFGFFLPLIPQFLYWKKVTGKYITYSYGSQKFDFLHPHIFDGLFSFNNGWLIYSPLMITALLGLLIGLYRKKRMILAVFLVFAIHTYVIYSWWCWNYINGFGSRAMVDIYPLLAIPIALFFQSLGKKSIARILTYAIVSVFILLNLFQTYQFHLKVLCSEVATSAYYYSIFGKTSLNHNALVALDCNIIQPENLKLKEIIAQEDFEEEEAPNIDTILYFSGAKSMAVQPGFEFSKGIKTTVPTSVIESGDWFRISAQCLSKTYGNFHENSYLVFSINRDDQKLLWKSMRINNKIREEYYSIHNGEVYIWKEVGFFVPTKGLGLKTTDKISVYAWNPTKVKVNVDDLKLEIWGD